MLLLRQPQRRQGRACALVRSSLKASQLFFFFSFGRSALLTSPETLLPPGGCEPPKGSDRPCDRPHDAAAAAASPRRVAQSEGSLRPARGGDASLKGTFTWRRWHPSRWRLLPPTNPSPPHPKAKPLHRNRSTFRNLLPTPLTSIRPRPLGATRANNNMAAPPPPRSRS